jgi:hypothetical protein
MVVEAVGGGEGSTVARQSDEESALSPQDLLPQGSGPKTQNTTRRRPLPAMVRREVYRQSRGVCQHRMPEGRDEDARDRPSGDARAWRAG